MITIAIQWREVHEVEVLTSLSALILVKLTNVKKSLMLNGCSV
jgi:hypothetical protein